MRAAVRPERWEGWRRAARGALRMRRGRVPPRPFVSRCARSHWPLGVSVGGDAAGGGSRCWRRRPGGPSGRREKRRVGVGQLRRGVAPLPPLPGRPFLSLPSAFSLLSSGWSSCSGRPPRWRLPLTDGERPERARGLLGRARWRRGSPWGPACAPACSVLLSAPGQGAPGATRLGAEPPAGAPRSSLPSDSGGSLPGSGEALVGGCAGQGSKRR